jgi:hypothetical protein
VDIIQISWRDIPGRDNAWYEYEKSRMTEDEIARELDISYEKSSRAVVFKEFKEAHILRKEYKVNPNLKVIRTLDYGKIACACLFSQKDNFGNITFFKEIVLENESDPTRKLARAVQSYSSELICQGFVDHDDPAGTTDNYVNENETSFKIVQQYGIHPTHHVSGASNTRLRNRVELAKHLLAQFPEGEPVIRIHESMTYTIDALQGGYRHREDRNTKQILDEIIEEHPHEDVADCFGITLVEELTVENQMNVPKRQSRRGNKYTGW